MIPHIQGLFFCTPYDTAQCTAHSPAGELEMRKNLSKDFKGATRMALMRALKWAPTWYVSADISTFISYPDLIQRLAIKGISGVSPDLSSGGSFRSSHSGHSHGTLENNWEVFFAFRVPLPDCAASLSQKYSSFKILHWTFKCPSKVQFLSKLAEIFRDKRIPQNPATH